MDYGYITRMNFAHHSLVISSQPSDPCEREIGGKDTTLLMGIDPLGVELPADGKDDVDVADDEGVEFGVVKEEGGRRGMLLGTLRSLLLSLVVDGGLIGGDRREGSLVDDESLAVLCSTSRGLAVLCPTSRGLAVLCPPSPSLCLLAAPPLCLRILSLPSLCLLSPATKCCCGHWLVSSSAACRDS